MTRNVKTLIKTLTHCSALLFLSTPLFATPCGNYYFGGMAGASWSDIGKRAPQINYYNGDLTDTYPLTSRQSTTPVVGLNGGYEFTGERWKPAIALGLGVYNTLAGYHYHGQVIETASGDPSFLLYNYRYNINSTRLMAETQFTWIVRNFAPFINLGIGPAWNQMNSYAETVASENGFVAVPPFRSRTKTTFAYQAGFGLGYMFNFGCPEPAFKHERLSLGYRYANLGNTSFATRGSTYPYSLNTGRLRTNDVYLAYTHLF